MEGLLDLSVLLCHEVLLFDIRNDGSDDQWLLRGLGGHWVLLDG